MSEAYIGLGIISQNIAVLNLSVTILVQETPSLLDPG